MSSRLDGRNCWKKLIQIERRPLVLSILVTLFLLFMAMVAFVTYLLLVPAIGQHGIDQPGDGEDSRLNGPSNSTIGILRFEMPLVPHDWFTTYSVSSYHCKSFHTRCPNHSHRGPAFSTSHPLAICFQSLQSTVPTPQNPPTPPICTLHYM